MRKKNKTKMKIAINHELWNRTEQQYRDLIIKNAWGRIGVVSALTATSLVFNTIKPLSIGVILIGLVDILTIISHNKWKKNEAKEEQQCKNE